MNSGKKYQADVIIIGGIAGITTALELLGHNKSVVLLDRDKQKFFGSQAITAFGGMLLTDTPEQKKKYSWLILNQKIALKELALSGAEHNPAIRDKNALKVAKGMLFGQKDLLEKNHQ